MKQAVLRERNGTAIVDTKGLDALLASLREKGYTTLGPTLRDGAIIHDEIQSVRDLPEGWTEEQEPGSYRIQERSHGQLFGFASGPISWKKFLYPSSVRLMVSRKGRVKPLLTGGDEVAPRFALIGVRPCDLRAIQIQDRVLLGGPYQDPIYRSRREHLFIVAVNCTNPGGTCFCASMGTGPRAGEGFDLALTEFGEGGGHAFLVEVGSEKGNAVLEGIPGRKVADSDLEAVERLLTTAGERMGRELKTSGIKDLLYRSYDHPRWLEVAERCLSCGNCTMVCPTCFCSNVEDRTDLSGRVAERWRRWDSCFTLDFTYIHGGNVRVSTRSRYRQWLTHKLGTWQDQFGTSGCVGCGRCITWCPVGIDITEEVGAIRESQAPIPV